MRTLILALSWRAKKWLRAHKPCELSWKQSPGHPGGRSCRHLRMSSSCCPACTTTHTHRALNVQSCFPTFPLCIHAKGNAFAKGLQTDLDRYGHGHLRRQRKETWHLQGDNLDAEIIHTLGQLLASARMLCVELTLRHVLCTASASLTLYAAKSYLQSRNHRVHQMNPFLVSNLEEHTPTCQDMVWLGV